MQDEWMQGFACACSILINNHGESTMSREIYECNFKTVTELSRAGVDEYDIMTLKPTIKEIQRKRKQRRPGAKYRRKRNSGSPAN